MKEFEKEEPIAQEKAEQNGQKEFRFTTQSIIVCMAMVAMFLFVLCKVLFNFGVGSNVFYGIMSIVIYGLPLAGIIWSYLSAKKFTLEFWLNVIVFGLVIWLF